MIACRSQRSQKKAYLKQKIRRPLNFNFPAGKRGIVEASSSEPPGKRPCPSASEATTTHENGLHRDDEGYVHVYTDGSCENNGRSGARAGYGIWWADNHPLNRGEAAAKPTNNAAEIEAASQAVKLASKAGITKLRIFTDSKFTIQCVTSWMPSWKRNGWKTAKNEPVKNQKELEDLDCALKQGTQYGLSFIFCRLKYLLLFPPSGYRNQKIHKTHKTKNLHLWLKTIQPFVND